MSAPRTKRQFAGTAADPSQRQITSFFTSSRSPPSTNGTHTTSESMQPALPATVQSNLLSVGMRVRKSVPEGYKTGTMSAFKLWSDNTPAPTPMRTAAPAPTRTSTKELLPFCGINRIGGLDVQPEPPMYHDDLPSLESLPELTMSQESNVSNVDAESSRKRSFDDEDADEDERPQLWDGEASPHTLASMDYRNTRIIAAPRSRIGKAFKNTGQENTAVDGDFDEAEFLVFTGNGEMDMSG